MRNVLIALALLLPCTALAEEWACDANGGVCYRSSRVIELPADQDRVYCTVFGDPRDEQYQHIVRWFSQNQQLASLRAKTHFATIPTNSKMFAARYASTVDQLPCIRLQNVKGETLCQISGNRIPLSAEATANCIDATLRRRNVQPQPVEPNLNYHFHWAVEPENKLPDIKPQPDVYADEQEMTLGPAWIWLLIGAAVVSIGAGVALEWRKSHQD